MRLTLSFIAALLVAILSSCTSVPVAQPTPPEPPAAPNTEVIDLTNQVVALQQQVAQLRESLAGAQTELDALPVLRTKIAELQSLTDAQVKTIAKLTSGDAKAQALVERERVLMAQVADLSAQVNAALASARSLTLQRDQALAQASKVAVDFDHFVQRIAALELLNADLEKRTLDLTELAGLETKALDARIVSLSTLFAKEIAAGEIQIKRFRNVLVIDVKDTVLFAPDRPELLKANLSLLLRLADVFKKSPERIVRVEGSTAVALSSPETLRVYPTSWHLGAARAANVVQYLQEVGHMDPSQLVAASLGEYSPVADNATELGKALNRRVEFIMTPRELWQTERLAAVGR